jgi:hypothetical protein
MKIKFEPRDIWVGVYWKTGFKPRHRRPMIRQITLYVCIVPMLPIVFTIDRNAGFGPKVARAKKADPQDLL